MNFGLSSAMNEMSALSNLLKKADDEDDSGGNHTNSVYTNPGAIGAPAPEPEPEDEKPKLDPNAIWDETTVEDDTAVLYDESDPRQIPQYDLLFQQKLSAEDACIGIDMDRDPSMSAADSILIKIKLPGEKGADLDLDVKRTRLVLQAKNHKLVLPLPFSVRDKDGKAQWVKDKEELHVTLPNAMEDPLYRSAKLTEASS
eukprot:Rmarinus@m.24861